MKFVEIVSYSSGEPEVVARVELDGPEEVCRVVTEYPALEAMLVLGVMGPGGPSAGPVTPDDGELFLSALEIEFGRGTTRVGEIQGEWE